MLFNFFKYVINNYANLFLILYNNNTINVKVTVHLMYMNKLHNYKFKFFFIY